MIKKLLQRGPHYVKVFNKLSSHDVILASYPKSGNTWIRYIIANYIGICDLKKGTITFSELDDIMPGLGKANFFHTWNYSIPKFSATHFKYQFLFKKTQNIYIIRDPRDVMVSYFFYLNKKENQLNFDHIIDLMQHPKHGLDAWFKHLSSWKGHIDFLVVYEDLLIDDDNIIQHLFKTLNIDFEKEHLKKAVERSRFNNFKKVENKFGHSKPEKNKEGFKFARKGKSGDHKNHFNEQCYDYYEKKLREYGYKDYEDILKSIKPYL